MVWATWTPHRMLWRHSLSKKAREEVNDHAELGQGPHQERLAVGFHRQCYDSN